MIFRLFEDWAQFIEVLGVWLAAFATAAATIVALRVSSRDLRQDLRVLARPTTLVYENPNATTKVFTVLATNLGRRPVTTAVISVRCRFPSYCGDMSLALPDSSAMPTTLADGETACWRYPIEPKLGESLYAPFAKFLADKNWVLRTLFLYRAAWTVETSLGKVFFAKPDKRFRSGVSMELKKAESGK